MTVVLNTTHLGVIGGGENYLMRLAMALDDQVDFYVTQNWPADFVLYNGFGRTFKRYSGLFQPEVYLHCSHFTRIEPIGERNYVVAFFPKKELRPTSPIDGCISICEYTATWVANYWDLQSFVLTPAIDPSLYRSDKKKKKIVSIGHFFEEQDGHSKNQHILAQAFDDRFKGWELVLLGNANPGDEPYVRKVRKTAEGKAIRVEVNKHDQFLKAELSSASHYWHANGYGRTDPGQTEHFGIVVLEAIASGAIPIVHASGGAPQIAGITWREPEDLAKLTLGHLQVPTLDKQYRLDGFSEGVAEWLRSV